MRRPPEVDPDELQARLVRVQRERDHLSGILQSMGDAVICTDQTRALSFMNARAETLTGWRFADAEGLPVSSIFALRGEEGELLTQDPLQDCLRSGSAQVSEKGYSLKTRDDYLRPIGFSVALIK